MKNRPFVEAATVTALSRIADQRARIADSRTLRRSAVKIGFGLRRVMSRSWTSPLTVDPSTGMDCSVTSLHQIVGVPRTSVGKGRLLASVGGMVKECLEYFLI